MRTTAEHARAASGAPLRILHLEDNLYDGELVRANLEADGLRFDVVQARTQDEFEHALTHGPFDLILSDFTLPSYGGMAALKRANEQWPDTPFIFVSGTIGEERAVEAMKSGATDYVLKDRLHRLGPVVRRALREASDRAERRRAEEALLQSQMRLTALVEIAVDAIIATDADQCIQIFNKGAETIFGYRAEEMLGKPIDLLLPQRFGEVHRQHMHAFAKASEPARLMGERHQVYGRRKDGSEFPAEASISKQLTAGQITYIVILRDISERIRQEEALRASEQRIRSVFAGAATGIAIASADGRFIEANPAFCDVVGYRVEELQALDLWTLTHPADLAANRPLVEKLLEGQIDSFVVEKRYLKKGGGAAWVRASMSVARTAGGAVQNIFAVTEDITERKQTEERLRRSQSLVAMAGRAARLGGWTVDLSAQHVDWSDEVCDIYEMPAGTVPTFEQTIAFYLPEWRPVALEAFQECATTGKPFDLEMEIVTARNRRRWVRAIGQAERDPAGNIVRVQGAIMDITERKETESELHQLADRLVTTLESVTDGFFTLDRQWRFIYVNRQAEVILQRSRESLLGRSIWDAFPDAVGTEFDHAYHRAVAESRAVSFEAYYPGLELWVDVTAYPSPQGLAVYFRDITRQQKTIEHLRLLEASIARLNDIVVITETEPITESGPRIVYVNDAFVRRTGFTREEAIGRTLAILHGPRTQRAVLAQLYAAMKAWEPFRTELIRYTKTGEEFWVEMELVPVADDEGRFTHWVIIQRDITERREAEARIAEQASLIDEARDAIVVRDMEHRIVFWNKGAERLYGWTAGEAVNQRFDELLRVDAATFEQGRQAVLQTREWSGELQKVARDGTVLTVNSRWTLIHDAEGRPRSVLTIDTDITNQKKLEHQIMRAQRLESIGTLAGGIAHDLNNVLAPILLTVELLKMDEHDEKRLEALSLIESNTRHGADLIKRVLSFARGTEGRRDAIHLGSIAHDVRQILRETFPKNITIHLEQPDDLWMVSGDATQMHQVLMNLCVNARDAMPQGGTLTLTLQNTVVQDTYAGSNPEARPGAYVALKVTDTGSGIRPEILERIFEPFFTTKEVGSGTGLGLSVTHGIVTRHGGFINVVSAPGQGTTFEVYLPAHACSELAESTTGEPARLPRGHGELVLVVDDEEDIRNVVRKTLELFGYRVLLAAHGTEALALYNRYGAEIAVVVTDMVMPVMDGPALIAALKAIRPDVKILIAGSPTADGNEARAAAAGVRYFVPKPYAMEVLLEALHRVLTEA